MSLTMKLDEEVRKQEMRDDYGPFLVAAGYRDIAVGAEDMMHLGRRIKNAVARDVAALKDAYNVVHPVDPHDWASIEGAMISREDYLRAVENLSPEEKQSIRDAINFVPQVVPR